MFVYLPLNHYIHSHGKYTKCRTGVNLSWEPRKKGKHLRILIKCIQELSFMKVNNKDNPIMHICHIIFTHHLLLQRVSLFENWKFMSTKKWPFYLILLLRALLQNWNFTSPKTGPFYLILLLRTLLQNWKFTSPKTRPIILFCY
jgi:hypothetical protein